MHFDNREETKNWKSGGGTTVPSGNDSGSEGSHHGKEVGVEGERTVGVSPSVDRSVLPSVGVTSLRVDFFSETSLK